MTVSRRAAIVRAIVAKDLREFSRDRLWLVLTPLMLVFYVAIFWLLPSTVDESITVVADAIRALGSRIDRQIHRAIGGYRVVMPPGVSTVKA